MISKENSLEKLVVFFLQTLDLENIDLSILSTTANVIQLRVTRKYHMLSFFCLSVSYFYQYMAKLTFYVIYVYLVPMILNLFLFAFAYQTMDGSVSVQLTLLLTRSEINVIKLDSCVSIRHLFVQIFFTSYLHVERCNTQHMLIRPWIGLEI